MTHEAVHGVRPELAFQVAADDLEEAAEHVRSYGIEVFGPHRFGDVGDAYFFCDPDDNLVEFYPYADG